MRRSTLPASVVAAAVLCSLAGRAGAQISYTEGTDLNGQSIGTASLGDNVITGSINATVISMSMVSGDAMDTFQITIPAGLSVTGISMTISNYGGSGTVLLNPGVQIVGGGFMFAATTSGLNTLTLPAPGYLDPGTHTLSIFTGVSPADPVFSSRSLNYVVRIHVDPLTGACCNRWNGTCGLLTAAGCASVGLRYDGNHATCSPATCRGCAADFDGSGTPPAVGDIFAFLTAWFAGCP